MRIFDFPLVLHLAHRPLSVALSIMRDNVAVVAFSERVVGFVLSHIEVTGGTLSNFIGNGREFCVTIETDSSAELFVPAGVVRDVNDQLNTASNRLVYHA